MKIANHKLGSVTRHYHRIEVEDGPIIEAGNVYVDGTQFRVELIRRERFDNEPWENAKVSGHRVNKNGSTGAMTHDRVFLVRHGLPEWLEDILAESEKTLKTEEYLAAGDVEDQIDKEIHESLARGEV